jgi:hypothetical protein
MLLSSGVIGVRVPQCRPALRRASPRWSIQLSDMPKASGITAVLYQSIQSVVEGLHRLGGVTVAFGPKDGSDAERSGLREKTTQERQDPHLRISVPDMDAVM